MDEQRTAVLGTVGLILLLSVLTGPSIGLLTVPTDEPFAGKEIATGNASVTDVDFPAGPRISRGEYDSGVYNLQTGDAQVTLSNITGYPILVYKLEIYEFGYTRSSLIILESGMEGERVLKLASDTIESNKLNRSSYEGELRILLRGEGPDRIVASTNVTVSIDR